MPNSDRVLIEPPDRRSRVREPISEIGTTAALIRARRLLPSPSSSTANTRSTASRSDSTALSMLVRTVRASSTITSIATPGGKRGSSSFNASVSA